MENAPRNAVHWFEIPVRDLDRAQVFYEKLLDAPLRRDMCGPQRMAVFPSDQVGVGGCLMADDPRVPPQASGTLVYLNAEPCLESALSRAKAAGGRITTPKTQLPDDMGCFAHVLDPEGNRVGLHAQA
jgi:predicted enzyme related to lactoylglutathione lyase